MDEILHQLIGCLTHYYKVSTIQGGAWLNFSTHSKPQHVFMNGCFMICWSDSCCILGMGWGFDQTAPKEQQPSQCVDFGGGSWRPEFGLHLMILMWHYVTITYHKHPWTYYTMLYQPLGNAACNYSWPGKFMILAGFNAFAMRCAVDEGKLPYPACALLSAFNSPWFSADHGWILCQGQATTVSRDIQGVREMKMHLVRTDLVMMIQIDQYEVMCRPVNHEVCCNVIFPTHMSRHGMCGSSSRSEAEARGTSQEVTR